MEEVEEEVEEKAEEKVEEKSINKKKDRYYDRGHCKYKSKCRYSHSQDICRDYIDNQRCESKKCLFRHPKVCKWWKSKEGCKRQSGCDYLHVTLANDDLKNSVRMYKCISCKSSWDDIDCVIEHKIEDKKTYFCLNCDDWVKDKLKVFNYGWSLSGSGWLPKGSYHNS